MKGYIVIIVILLLSARNINAQYSLMTHGERCPFDTSVAIQIDTYRLESLKMKLADSLINSLTYQVQLSDSISYTLQKQLALSAIKGRIKEEELNTKQETIDKLLKQLEYKPEPTWWDKYHKPAIFVGGVVVGIGGSILLLKIVRN